MAAKWCTIPLGISDTIDTTGRTLLLLKGGGAVTRFGAPWGKLPLPHGAPLCPEPYCGPFPPVQGAGGPTPTSQPPPWGQTPAEPTPGDHRITSDESRRSPSCRIKTTVGEARFDSPGFAMRGLATARSNCCGRQPQKLGVTFRLSRDRAGRRSASLPPSPRRRGSKALAKRQGAPIDGEEKAGDGG